MPYCADQTIPNLAAFSWRCQHQIASAKPQVKPAELRAERTFLSCTISKPGSVRSDDFLPRNIRNANDVSNSCRQSHVVTACYGMPWRSLVVIPGLSAYNKWHRFSPVRKRAELAAFSNRLVSMISASPFSSWKPKATTQGIVCWHLRLKKNVVNWTSLTSWSQG